MLHNKFRKRKKERTPKRPAVRMFGVPCTGMQQSSDILFGQRPFRLGAQQPFVLLWAVARLWGVVREMKIERGGGGFLHGEA